MVSGETSDSLELGRARHAACFLIELLGLLSPDSFPDLAMGGKENNNNNSSSAVGLMHVLKHQRKSCFLLLMV